MRDPLNTVLVASWLLLLLATAISAQQPGRPPAPSLSDEEASGLPYTYSIAGFEDQGTFTLLINEEQVGTTEFAWRKDGSYDSHFLLKLGGQSNQVDVVITPDESGVWKRVETKSSRGTVLTEREGRLVRTTFQEKKATGQIKERSAAFDNYGPALGAAIVREYDAAKGGRQPLSVCILGGGAIDGVLERLAAVERPVDGRDLSFSRYRISIQALDIDIWLNQDGRVVFEEVPVQKAVFVRKGFEDLATRTIEDPLLSKPSFEVSIQKDVMVPARDGIKLAADVYLPKVDGKFPLTVYRTPYGKELMELKGKYWARRGYACAIQDCRGRFKSQGTWVPNTF